MKTRLLINANIHTFNPSAPLAEAVAIKDGKFIAVGDKDSILSGFKTDVIIDDIQNMHVLPGITDAHIHLLNYGMSLTRVNCETDTRAKCLQAVADRVRETKAGHWVIGHGWNHNIWHLGNGTKEDLDAIAPRNPVYLSHKSLHSAWVNSSALREAGITANTSDPENGLIERDESGKPTGILYESAMRLVEDMIPDTSPKQRENALALAQQSLNSFGITSAHDFDTWDCYETLRQFEQASKLKLRIMKSIPFSELDNAITSGLKSGDGGGALRIGWLKLFSDGALGPQTAAMHRPYKDMNSNGLLFLDSMEIIRIGQKAMSNGISTAIHAIGDRANFEVMNGFSKLFSDGYFENLHLKPRIEHVQIIDPDDSIRMAKIGITASMQPIHAISDRLMADKFWGGRCRNAYAWKSIQDAGSLLIFGSDAPVESPNPFWGVYAALTRQPLEKGDEVSAWYPEQQLTIQESLQAYIRNPHIASSQDQHLGMIKNGYLADLFVISSDIYHIAAEDIRDMLPQRVMFNGDWI